MQPVAALLPRLNRPSAMFTPQPSAYEMSYTVSGGALNSGMTKYPTGPHRTTPDHTGPHRTPPDPTGPATRHQKPVLWSWMLVVSARPLQNIKKLIKHKKDMT